MKRLILSKEQVSDLIFENRYKFVDNNKFHSRCIDGRYKNDERLEPLAIPGADAGELALIVATANSFGFPIDITKAYKALVSVVGGEKNLRFHTDSHAPKGEVVGGCGHIKQITLTPEDYRVDAKQVEEIKKLASKAIKAGAEEIVLEGDHNEGAVLVVTGSYSVLNQYEFESADGKVSTQVFVYHKSLCDLRHKALARELIAQKAVTLPKNGKDDEDYLYIALSETAETHLFETAKRLAKGLPLYHVDFKDDGGFDIGDEEII